MALCNFDKGASTTADIVKCCTFEAEVKGVIKGHFKLDSTRFQKVIFTRDSHDTRVYWVKLVVKLAETLLKHGIMSAKFLH